MKIFDMARFKSMLERESRRPCPNRRFLQSQCISIISFVVDDHKMLNLPSWIMIFNIVAIDLLKIELGLLDSNDLYLGGPASMSDPAANRRRFGYHLADYRQADSEVSSPPPSTAATSSNGAMRHRDRISQLTASKKAFANAAASGAYNGEHCNEAIDGSHGSRSSAIQQSKEGRLRRYIDKFERGAAHEKEDRRIGPVATASVESMHKLGKQDNHHLLLTETADVQQSSSSSGFNSHCSSQNDSSAASSSSNIAASGASNPDELRVEEARGDDGDSASSGDCSKPIKSQLANKALFYKHLAQSAKNSESAEVHLRAESGSPPTQSRGKRPPKLPHRLSAPGSRPKMTQPVPIPAPPTSAGGGPSGKANLILVSPTGLSPPLPKRKGHQAVGKGLHPAARPQAALDELPEFSTIKHIDENGRCSVLVTTDTANSQRELAPKVAPIKLPAGIPAHAQLAPPATQRHILRYLMSATRGKMAEQPPQQQRFANGPPPIRYQRPLPIVPSQRMGGHQRQEEESLYYCGLQARVSNRLRMPAERRTGDLPSSNSAMNAILTDFRRNSHEQQLGAAYLKQHISLTNLQETLNAQYRQQQIRYSGANLSSPSSKQQISSQSITRPLLKFFKPSSTSVSTVKNSGQPSAAGGEAQTGPMFLSVDNLNNPSGHKLNPLSFRNLPLKLKRSKTKKPAKDG